MTGVSVHQGNNDSYRSFPYLVTLAIASGGAAGALNMLNSEQGPLISRTLGATTLGLSALATEMFALYAISRGHSDENFFDDRRVLGIALTSLAALGLSVYLPYSQNSNNNVSIIFAVTLAAHFILLGSYVVRSPRKADHQKPIISISEITE